MTQRAAAVAELKSTFEVLKADLDAAVAQANANDSAFARRSLVRCLFALIEGVTNLLCFVAAAAAPLETGVFSAPELLALREESLDVTDGGEVRTRNARIPLKNRIRLALAHYPRIHGTSFSPSCGDAGWVALQDAIRIRDRLTHPKSTADLVVSDNDARVIRDASSWYQNTVRMLLVACADADSALR